MSHNFRKCLNSVHVSISVMAIIVVSGCATPSPTAKYEGMSFDSFIDSLPGKLRNDPESKWAHRVKSFYITDRNKVGTAFRNWCRAKSGAIHGSDILQDIRTLSGYGDAHPRSYGGLACMKPDKSSYGTYIEFGLERGEASIAFYTDEQAPLLHVIAKQKNEQREAETRARAVREVKCREEANEVFRNKMGPGTHAHLRGDMVMVVEVKAPLALVQTLGPAGSSRWVETKDLAAPVVLCD
jgi:hypothetical protein